MGMFLFVVACGLLWAHCEWVNIKRSQDIKRLERWVIRGVGVSKTIKVKFFDGVKYDIKKYPVGDWVDLRAGETVILKPNEYYQIKLGVAMELPDGYEALIVARSSLFKEYGVISPNGVNVIDGTYRGNHDEWHFPVYAVRHTMIREGDRICQFRILRNQPEIYFNTVKRLGAFDRGGFGSTGKR